MKKKLTALILGCVAVVVIIVALIVNMNAGGKKETGQKAAETSGSVVSEAETEASSERTEEASKAAESSEAADKAAVSEAESVSSSSAETEAADGSVAGADTPNQTAGSDVSGNGQPPLQEGNTTEIIKDDDGQGTQSVSPTAEPQPSVPATPTPAPQEPQPTEEPAQPADDGRDPYETPIIIDPD